MRVWSVGHVAYSWIRRDVGAALAARGHELADGPDCGALLAPAGDTRALEAGAAGSAAR